MLPAVKSTINDALAKTIPEERKNIIFPLINYIRQKLDNKEPIHLNFICTHNSRRSQLAQVWAQTAAFYYNLPVTCYSGGIEITAFNERAIAALQKSGFKISSVGENNPIYSILYTDDQPAIRAFSKLFDNETNTVNQFAAIMTCAHADENCPFIPRAETRIALRYEDPKKYDNTPLEANKYYERSMQIASEMLYAFSHIRMS